MDAPFGEYYNEPREGIMIGNALFRERIDTRDLLGKANRGSLAVSPLDRDGEANGTGPGKLNPSQMRLELERGSLHKEEWFQEFKKRSPIHG